MKNGRFKCIGPAQHLKTKFGDGYMLQARLAKSHPADKGPGEFCRFTEECFPDAEIVEWHDRSLTYQMPTKYTWTELFTFLEQAAEIFQLEDHSVSQPSLESVFVRLVTEKLPEEAKDKRRRKKRNQVAQHDDVSIVCERGCLS